MNGVADSSSHHQCLHLPRIFAKHIAVDEVVSIHAIVGIAIAMNGDLNATAPKVVYSPPTIK